MANINQIEINGVTYDIEDAGARASLASEYSASATYAVGDYVLYNGQLYRCNTAITTAEAWTAAHWTAAKISNDVAELKSALSEMPTVFDFERKTINVQGEISDSTTRLLSEIVTLESGDQISVSSGYSFRIAYYTVFDVFHYMSEWMTSYQRETSGQRARFVFRKDDDSEITNDIITNKISTNIDFKEKYSVEPVVTETKAYTDSLFALLPHELHNEFDPDNVTPDHYIDSSGAEVENVLWCISNYMPIHPESFYTISTVGNAPYAAYYDSGKNYISVFKPITGTHPLTDIPNNAAFVRFSVKTDETTLFVFGAESIADLVTETELEEALEEALAVNQYSINKNLTGQEDMIWSWWYYPQVFSFHRVRDKLYWGYTTRDGYTGIAQYDFNTQFVTKNNLKKSDVDDHNGLAVYIMPNGKIVCAYSGGHNTDNAIHIRISTVAESIEQFNEEIALVSYGYTSYSQLIYSGYTLYLFYRVNNSNWAYRKSTDGGETWSDEITIITSTMQYYCKFMYTTTNGVIRMCMTSNPGADDSNIRMGFLHLSDGGIYNSDNTTLLGTRNVSYLSFDIIIPNESGKTQRLFDVAITPIGSPLILYAPFSSLSNNDSVYKLYDSGNVYVICNGGESIWNPKYQCGCSFIDTDEIVSIRESNGSDIVEMYSYNNGAVTLNDTLYSEEIGQIPIRNARPIIDVNKRAFLWHRGYYKSDDYTKFNTDAKIHLLT